MLATNQLRRIAFAAILLLLASGCGMDDTVEAMRDSTQAMRESTQEIQRNTEEVKQSTQQLESLGSSLAPLGKVELGGALNELKFSLVLAFVALGFLVTALANAARTKSAQFFLENHKELSDRADSKYAPAKTAVEQSANDFLDSYRWFFLIVLGMAVYFVVVLNRKCEHWKHDDWWYVVYLAGLLISGWIAWSFYSRESRGMTTLTGGRLRFPSGLPLPSLSRDATLSDPPS